MNQEVFERFMQASMELRRQAIEADHARELEILEVADRLIRLIPAQIASLQLRSEILNRTLEAAKMTKDLLERKQAKTIEAIDAATENMKAENEPPAPCPAVPDDPAPAYRTSGTTGAGHALPCSEATGSDETLSVPPK